MPLFGNIVVIKRNGTDGITFPLTANSCLFGRRTECDIRIQLPQVSKEHCKIEVNENKEAILTNLSTVNPTQLNGGCFQQPVPLKHGDVLTIIDRSFRFEYPRQSTPRKRRSRTPKDETLQVLHVQQVAEVESFHQQHSGPKSPHASDNAECEEKIANENKQSTEENISKALPIKLQTPKSSYRIHQSIKKQNEMSPFSKLYEKLKQEMKVKKSLQEGNVSQQAAKEDGKRVLLEPSTRISSWNCVIDLQSLMKEKEIGRRENIQECKITMRPEAIGSELNQSSAEGATKKSLTRSPRTPVSKEGLRHTGRSHSQDHKEINTAEESKGTEVTPKPSKNNDGNAAFLLNQCSIERLGYADRTHSSAIALGELVQTTNVTNVSEVNKCVPSMPTPTRRSPRSPFIPPTKEISGMDPLNTDTPTTRRRPSLKRKSFSENSAEAQREASLGRNDSLNQLPLAESTCLKQRRSSKQHTPKAVKEAVLKEICDQANFGNLKEGHSETPVSLSNSKSPRRSNRRSKELSNKSVRLETLASEELTLELTSPAGQKSESGRKRGELRTSGLLMEKALETSASQEDHNKMTDRKDSGAKEELATKGDHQKQDLEDASVMRPRRLSSKRRSSGSPAVLKDNEVVSELMVSGLLAGEDSGKTRRVSLKRKSGDVLPQTLGKRKRVSFGGHLSPELFDKSLPPNSPLKKGAIPARLSLPFGNSPRAVLKKGLKDFAVQKLPEHLQKEKMSPKPLPAQKSPTASSPASGKAASAFTLGSSTPYRKGRFSISQITTPLPIAEDKEAVEEDVNTKEKNGARVKTPKSPRINQDDKTILTATPDKSRSSQLSLKVTPMKRRSGAVAVINAKRRSGASSANLLVAKSWAEVVKLGVARPQSKTVKKHVRKGRSLRKIPKSPKTPERKITGHVSTGHAESPATIVVGRAYSTTVRTAGQVPKVVKNPILKLNMNMDESFTGMTEMFQTPENKSGKSLPLAAVQKTDFTPTCSAAEISELHTPEESGEMMVSPLNSTDASEQKQDSPGICHLLRDKESLNSVFDAVSTKTPEKRKAVLEKNTSGGHLSIIPEKRACQVKSGSKRRTPKQKLELVEVMSGVKQLFRTPEQSPEPVEALSGIKQLMRTPKQKSEPAEALSGIKQLMRTPEQKSEPVEALSGIKQLMRTPKRKVEPVETLSGIKQLMRTPKQKSEPVEALSGIKQLMRTPKQKSEPVEALSGIKQLMRTPKRKVEPVETLLGIKQLMRTPKQKSEPVEALSGIKQLMRTPKQKSEPVEALSGIKHLMRTPKRKVEPIEALSGIRQLMRTPQQKPEPVEVLSGIKQLLKTPQQESEPITGEVAVKRLLKTPVQKRGAVKDVAGDTVIKQTPKVKYQPVEDMVGVSRIFKTPKEKVEPVENMFGFSRLVKTPKEKYQPVDDFVGLQRLMAEPKQKCSDFEVDYVGVKEMFDIPEEIKARSVNVTDSKREDTAPPCTNSSQKSEDKGNTSQGEDSQQKESTSEDQRSTRGRARKTVHPASAKQHEKDLNLKAMQSVEKKSTQEMKEINISPSVAKNQGRGRRANRCIQEEIVSKHPGQEEVETVSLVEPCGAPQRTRRGKRKELEHPSENLESCGKGASVLRKELANMKESLQECGINNVLETEDDPTVKAVSVSSSVQNENYQLQMGIKIPENKSDDGGVKNSEELLLSPGKRSRGAKEVENIEPPIPPKRGRRAKNDQLKQAPSEDLQRTTRRLRRAPLVIQRDEPTSDKATETARAEGAESGTKLEIKVTEKRVKSLRRARKDSTEVKADICSIGNEKKTENIQKTEETSAETQSHIADKIKVSQGDETENIQENPTEASQRLKTESPSGETNKMPVTALSLEGNRRAVRETNRTRNRRGKNDSWEKEADEFAGDVNSLELIVPKLKSETERDESSLKDSLSSAGASVPAANGDTRARGRQKPTRNQQGTLKPNQTEILQENQAPTNGTAFRRDRGRKVTFELKEANSKSVGRKRRLTGDDKGITYKDGPHETSENPALQVRRNRRKQVDSVPEPQTTCSALVENQTLVADHSKDEAFVEEQDSALEATPSSAEDNPPRRGRRREVAAASQTSRSLSVRRRRGLLEGEDQKTAGREDQTPASGNKTWPANASGRDKRKKIDPAAEAKSSSSLSRECDSSETNNKEESANEEQNTPLETVSCANKKPLGRGRRRETALASHATNCVSLRGKRGLAADSGREQAPKEDQNVPLETFDLSVKENQQRRGRRKETDVVLETTSSIRGKRGLSKESSGRNNNGEAKKLILENSTSQEKMNLSEGNSMQTITSLALGSTTLQDLPEDGKNKLPEEQQSEVLNVAPPAKNLSRVGRKKTVPSKSEETGSTSLREKPKDRGQKRVLKEGEGTSLENNSPQEKTRQLRNKKKKVEFSSEAATSTSSHKNGILSGNDDASETQNGCLTTTGSENNNRSGKGKEVNPVQQATSTSRRRRCQLPGDDVASKKLKSENDENKSLQRGRRNKTKELCEEAVSAALAAAGTDRRTRSTTRASARTRK